MICFASLSSFASVSNSAFSLSRIALASATSFSIVSMFSVLSLISLVISAISSCSFAILSVFSSIVRDTLAAARVSFARSDSHSSLIFESDSCSFLRSAIIVSIDFRMSVKWLATGALTFEINWKRRGSGTDSETLRRAATASFRYLRLPSCRRVYPCDLKDFLKVVWASLLLMIEIALFRASISPLLSALRALYAFFGVRQRICCLFDEFVIIGLLLS